MDLISPSEGKIRESVYKHDSASLNDRLRRLRVEIAIIKAIENGRAQLHSRIAERLDPVDSHGNYSTRYVLDHFTQFY